MKKIKLKEVKTNGKSLLYTLEMLYKIKEEITRMVKHFISPWRRWTI